MHLARKARRPSHYRTQMAMACTAQQRLVPATAATRPQLPRSMAPTNVSSGWGDLLHHGHVVRIRGKPAHGGDTGCR